MVFWIPVLSVKRLLIQSTICKLAYASTETAHHVIAAEVADIQNIGACERLRVEIGGHDSRQRKSRDLAAKCVSHDDFHDHIVADDVGPCGTGCIRLGDSAEL